jgi:hypothetical protein
MQRRKLLAGLGTLAVGGAAATGTGAFTSAEASRSVDVNVADEDKAYLALEALDSGESENYGFVTQQGTGITIDINDVAGVHDPANGVGLDSVYEFDNLFRVENQGTQEIEFEIDTLSDSDFTPSASGLTVEFYPGSDPSSPLESNPSTLGTGTSQRIGIRVDTVDPDIDDFTAETTVSADAT